MFYKNKKKKGKRGRKGKLRDINNDIMEQLLYKEAGVDQSFSESSNDETESQMDSESSQTSMQLGFKTAMFILEEMIINSSSSCSKQHTTFCLNDNSASGTAPGETHSTNTPDNLNNNSVLGICDLELSNIAPSTTLTLETEEEEKRSKESHSTNTELLKQ
ncbi:unnamed protein product [Cercopithifilaria johnstoni]|uniref:Uncharacterized protein n=1 Tax=Cercopithifilaria johnstoni TaxID=2874296 RepID=A0A8J2Q381_9BILA|nr:unnamed protein product [Cercopithifilaria johnstoni]